MRTVSQLLELVAPWCGPARWECIWSHHADWKKHEADAAEMSRAYRDQVKRGKPTGDFDRYASQSREFAETSHRCRNELLNQLQVINDLLIEVAPKLLGELPLIRADVPGDGLEVAARMRRLYGLLVAKGPLLDPAAAPPAGTPPAKRRIPRDEAELLVAAAIANTPPDQRGDLTVRALNQATGVSVGMFPSLKEWQKLRDEVAGSVRAVPLTDTMRAVLHNQSADAAHPDAAAVDAEVLDELLSLANTDMERKRFEEMTPGERWQMLDLLHEQDADAKRDKRQAKRERPDCS